MTGDAEPKEPFADAPPPIKRLAFFLRGFYSESDRGAALMAASVLDEVLRLTISAFLVDGKQSKMLLEGFNAPLGTFNARILAAYSFGLIDEQEFAEIEAVRKIRNEFGHSWQDVGLDHPKVKAQLEKLPFEKYPPRERFNNTVANLLGDLLWRESLVRHERRQTRVWPHKKGFGRDR